IYIYIYIYLNTPSQHPLSTSVSRMAYSLLWSRHFLDNPPRTDELNITPNPYEKDFKLAYEDKVDKLSRDILGVITHARPPNNLFAPERHTLRTLRERDCMFLPSDKGLLHH
ncbi:hypothetical protein Ahia01_001216000, partial [Argonauta hians]